MLLKLNTRAQVARGTATDEFSGIPLKGVAVVDVNTQQTAYSDKNGYYQLPAADGDSILLTMDGYAHTIYVVNTVNRSIPVRMKQMSFIKLKEVEVHTPLTPYQQDSAKRRAAYNTELSKEKIKPKVAGISAASQGPGLTVDNLISSAAQRVSRKYKRNKKFKKNFEADEQQHFIETRYTPELVQSMTGLTGEPLGSFMSAYPMEYDFARTAGDLELKMWVRDNYKNYMTASATLQTGTLTK